MKMKPGFFFLILLALMPITSAQAQQLSTLHSFNGADGYVPQTGLTQGADGNLYGVTQGGGTYGYGVAFRISTSGSFALLHSFGQNSTAPQKPFGKLTPASNGNFYGTTTHGGTNDHGAIYKMASNGTVTVLHSMAFADGVGPTAGLLLASDGNFYGTAPNGGTGSGPVGSGTIFKVTPTGTLTVLHSFTAAFGNTNSDGQYPFGALVEGVDGKLYGTTYGGGQFGHGTLFVITKSGTFTSLYSFGAQAGDGSAPRTGLVRASDGSFYGTCSQGGSANKGTVFKMTTSGTAQSTNVQPVHTFQGVSGDGALPLSGLIQGNNGKLYGMTASGGANGNGLIYTLASGGIFNPLYSFGAQATDGAAPNDTLFQTSDGALYGTTSGGGTANAGTIFKFGAATPTKISATYEGKVRDRVGQGDVALKADGQNDATFTIQLQAGSGTRVVTSLDVNRGDGNEWDTTPNNAKWVVGAAAGLDSALLNSSNGAVNFSLPENATIEIFASENGNLFSAGRIFTITVGFADHTTASTTVTLPVTDGLAPTTLTVNGSSSPAYPPVGTTVQGLADTVLQFSVQQIGTAGGVSVRVQATTTPNVETSWTDLPNPTKGMMTYEPTTNRYLLGTNEYPHTQSDPVYFRAKASAEAYPDGISNVVGPFNLTSNKPRIGTELFFTGNGTIADFYFKTVESASPSGLSVHVQSTTTPGSEQSWTDLPNGGAMKATSDPAQFVAFFNKLASAQGICFRAIARAPGYVDSISNIVGSFNVTSAIPPTVTLTPPTGTGSGKTADDPLVVSAGSLHFHVTAQTSRSLSQLALIADGKTLFAVRDGTSFIDYSTTAISVGDHVVEALAIDDRRVTGRAATGAIYLRVKPVAAPAMAERAADHGSAAASFSGNTYTAVRDFLWTQGSTWRNDRSGKTGDGFPGPNDFAILGDHHIKIDTADVVVTSISIGAGGLIGADPVATADRGSITVSGTMTITGAASFDGNLDILIKPGATCETANSSDISFNATSQGAVKIYNGGSLVLHGSGGLNNVDTLDNSDALIFLRPLAIPLDAATNPYAGSRNVAVNTLTHRGGIDAVDLALLLNNGNAKLINGDGAGLVTDQGAGVVGPGGASVVSHDGGTVVSNDGGSLINMDGAGTIAQGGGNVIAQGGGNVIAQGGGNVIAQGGGNLVSTNGGNFTAALKAPSASTPTGYVQNGGITNLSGVSIAGPVMINGGILSGSGIIKGDLTNNGGYITPGGSSSSGLMGVTGTFTQGAQGTTIVERGGPNASHCDQLQVAGAAHLGGKLHVKTINGYKPSASDTFNPLGYQSVSGSLSVSSNAQVTIKPTGILTLIDPSKPNPAAGQPLNISTRMQVLSGDNVLIAGFIITGPAGSTKKVLIRGLGPSLAKFGVPGTLNDPLLELHKPDGTLVSNDNWQQGDTSQIPSGFAPGDPRESLIVATLAPGNYSAVVKGAHGETGVGIAEVYDLNSGSTAQLANISTRGFVNTGDNVMIGGFIVGGSEPASVLVRAIGPSLSAFGVKGALPATTLELHDANGAVISNEGWRTTQEADIKATTIPPSNDKEAAILATLVPGNYTAVVRGKDNTTGIGLVEAYNLQ